MITQEASSDHRGGEGRKVSLLVQLDHSWTFVQFDHSSPPFLSRERAPVSVDVDPERRSPGDHETCFALETVQKSRVAAGKRCS